MSVIIESPNLGGAGSSDVRWLVSGKYGYDAGGFALDKDEAWIKVYFRFY